MLFFHIGSLVAYHSPVIWILLGPYEALWIFLLSHLHSFWQTCCEVSLSVFVSVFWSGNPLLPLSVPPPPVLEPGCQSVHGGMLSSPTRGLSPPCFPLQWGSPPTIHSLLICFQLVLEPSQIINILQVPSSSEFHGSHCYLVIYNLLLKS